MIKIGLVFRLIILISTPNLSQDFYRFFWDGQLILNGFNPYLNTPNQIIILKPYITLEIKKPAIAGFLFLVEVIFTTFHSMLITEL